VSGTTPRVGRVLVVDDEPLIAESLRLVLSDEFEVTTATHVADALARLTSGDWYDVVLCDVMMPGISGVELRSRVHAERPELAERFVFMTGGILMPSVQRMLERIPNVVLTKPFDFPALRELIRRRARSDPPPPRAARS
jgi:CheY-like chemotaxis protein